MKESPAKIDALLEPLLVEGRDDQADELLLQLINIHAEPVIKGVIRFKLRLSSYRATQRAEADDLYQEVLLQLLAQLQKFRKLPEGHPIADLRGMAAMIAHRTCARWLRRQFPNGTRSKIDFTTSSHVNEVSPCGRTPEGQLVAGFALWQTEAKTQTPRTSTFSKRCQTTSASKGGKSQELADTLASIFNYVGRPIDFDELVTAVAYAVGNQRTTNRIARRRRRRRLVGAGHVEPDPAWRIEKRMFLQRLWEELEQLPRNQRAALLLNLKDSSGFGCITLFPATGIATLRQLAAALEMTAESLAELWNELPLEDSRKSPICWD